MASAPQPSPARILAASGEARLASWLGRWVCLILLLIVERTALHVPYNLHIIPWHTVWWTSLLVVCLRALPRVLIAGAASTMLLGWTTFKIELPRLFADSKNNSGGWLYWLLLHVASVVTRDELTLLSLGGRLPVWASGEAWLWYRSALTLVALLSWGAAMLPPFFWRQCIAKSPGAFFGGMAFGVGVRIITVPVQQLFSWLQESTLLTVAVLLRLVGQQTSVNRGDALISTSKFAGQIGPSCSGLEGIGLIIAFLMLYLWWYRSRFRFPQVLVIFPLAAGLMWVLNAARITGLILLGGWNPKIGIAGFHSVAGWILFNATALGMVWASWRIRFFCREPEDLATSNAANPAGVYLVPLIAIIGTAMVLAPFSAGFEVLYPLRVLVAVGAFWYYRREIAAMSWKPSPWAIVSGALVFVLWIALSAPPANASTLAGFGTGLAKLPASGAAAWLCFRVVGAVVTVPIAEELAFRGYLVRKLIAADFMAVTAGQFTWLSFIGSSVLFGVLHNQLLAGTIAGMIFAIVLYRHGVLVDAIVAHSTANAFLSAYVLMTGRWFLWS
jgi:exosortase E/protease (VPEID-CTERM system)